MDNERYTTSNKWGKVALKAVLFPHQISWWSIWLACIAGEEESCWLLLYFGFSEAIYLERQNNILYFSQGQLSPYLSSKYL